MSDLRADEDTRAVVAMLTEGLSETDRLSLALELLAPQELGYRNEIPLGTLAIDKPGHGTFRGAPRTYLKNAAGWHCSNGATYREDDIDGRIREKTAYIVHKPTDPRPAYRMIDLDDPDDDDYDY